jgi:DME family drug/metabolite transporter
MVGVLPGLLNFERVTLASRFNFQIGSGELWAFGSALGYSLDNVFSAYAIHSEGINFMFAAVLRSLPVFIFSLIMVLSKRTESGAISPLSNWKLFLSVVAYGLLTFFIGNTAFFAALQKGGVLVTTPIVGTQVLWAALIAVPILKEPLNWKMTTGMLVSIAGILVLAVGRSSGTDLAENWWIAVFLALLCAFCWSVSGVLIAYAQRKGVNRFNALLIGLITGFIALNGYLFASGNSEVFTSTPPHLILNVLLAGLFNMLALIGITSALGLTSVASATTLGSLQVGIAPLLAWLFIGEDMNMLIGVGILLILGGVVYVQYHRKTISQLETQKGM